MTTSDAAPEKSAHIIDAALRQPTDYRQVLVVDDNLSVRETARRYLQEAGYSVTLASNGFEALARVVKCRPQVVLADITMPGLDGYQMCALMKSNSDYRHIPVIMLSSTEGLSDMSRAGLVGSDAHITKPFTAQTLTTAVRQVGQVPGAIER